MSKLKLYFYYSNLRPNNIKSFWKKIVYTCHDVETSISNKNNDHLERFIYYPFLDLRNGTLIKVKIQFWPFSLAYSIKSMIFFKFMYKDDPYFFLINNNMKNKKVDFFSIYADILTFLIIVSFQNAILFWKMLQILFCAIFLKSHLIVLTNT